MYVCVYAHIYLPAQANVKLDDVCPVIADWNVCCVSVCKQSIVTGQQVPQSVTHSSLTLPLSRNWAACLQRGVVVLTPSSKESLHYCPYCPSICSKAILII